MAWGLIACFSPSFEKTLCIQILELQGFAKFAVIWTPRIFGAAAGLASGVLYRPGINSRDDKKN
jgi:hypothetical protein